MVWIPFLVNQIYNEKHAEARDRTGGLQILSLTLSQLSYRGCCSGFFFILSTILGLRAQSLQTSGQWDLQFRSVIMLLPQETSQSDVICMGHMV